MNKLWDAFHMSDNQPGKSFEREKFVIRTKISNTMYTIFAQN